MDKKHFFGMLHARQIQIKFVRKQNFDSVSIAPLLARVETLDLIGLEMKP